MWSRHGLGLLADWWESCWGPSWRASRNTRFLSFRKIKTTHVVDGDKGACCALYSVYMLHGMSSCALRNDDRLGFERDRRLDLL